jgi:hypothetical protein
MVNAMNKVLRDCIPDITMPFLDDVPIKGCPVEERDDTVGPDGCRRFVETHIDDCEKVLQRLEDAKLTFSEEKSPFGEKSPLLQSLRAPMRAVRSETVSNEGRGNLSNEGRL